MSAVKTCGIRLALGTKTLSYKIFTSVLTDRYARKQAVLQCVLNAFLFISRVLVLISPGYQQTYHIYILVLHRLLNMNIYFILATKLGSSAISMILIFILSLNWCIKFWTLCDFNAIHMWIKFGYPKCYKVFLRHDIIYSRFLLCSLKGHTYIKSIN